MPFSLSLSFSFCSQITEISLSVSISKSKSLWSSALSSSTWSALWMIAACKHQKKAHRQEPGWEKNGISNSALFPTVRGPFRWACSNQGNLYIYISDQRLEDSTSWQRPHRSLQVNSQPSMLPLGGQLFFLPVPRFASCVHQDGLLSILTSFEDRWEKRQAPCLRFSGRASGSSSGNGTLLPWP